ncbi:uncharacterized protein LOC108735050 [Agrilus planipennis]|uniref:Uncharacterized protein LOC108735050 n=1 Tax=Agrilus planipennis TaxID=224129 RepID=A0A7F5RGV6_AGRPL|nr:uncharacterized protein LOC108735050 [Agrilus planipennis]
MDDVESGEEGEFPYVVQRVIQNPICFGSKIPRDTNPIGKNLSSFQKRYGNAEILTKLTPQTYNLEHLTSGVYLIQNKVRSNRGVSGLASRGPRMIYKRNRNPSPTRYELLQKRIFRKNKAPFNSNKLRKTIDESDAPGPGTYDPDAKKCRRTGLQNNFGRPTVEPAYEVKCLNKPCDVCIKCSKVCNYDYWHQDYTIFLCHFCMEEERLEREMYKSSELRKFKRMRTCTFVHDHQGTTAKIFQWERNKLNEKLRIENYLKKYMI